MTTVIEYALMAGASYLSTRPEVNRFPVPEGWVKVMNPDSYARDPNSGFEAISFTNGTEIVISFAGTATVEDWTHGNIPLAAGNLSDQLRQAADYYLQVKASAPAGATISFTGHSLGGGLSALMAVLFDESAFTFDQAPFRNTALAFTSTDANGNTITRSAAQDLRAYLTGSVPDTMLVRLDAYIAAADPTNTSPNAADTLVAREARVTDINVQGEILSSSLDPFSRIGTQANIPDSANGVAGTDLHSQALLTTFLQSNQTAAAYQTLSDATVKLPDLLKMIFDKNLFYNDPNNKDAPLPNLIEHLVQQRAVATDPATGMVTRFNNDLWKLAQDGGLTMSDYQLTGAPNNLSKTLIAFAMQKYYEENLSPGTTPTELFTDMGTGSNGIRFDMADVSKIFAIAIQVNEKLNLLDAKGFKEYFQLFMKEAVPDTGSGTVQFTAAEQSLINALLPYMRDWYIQAGASGMNATDTLNRGAFMLGGTGSDALVGGTGRDLLVGNAGDDLLQGGQGNDTLLGGAGNDTYVYTTGDGLDTILDTGGQNTLAMDGSVLAGGDQYGDARVHKDASGHLYVDAGQGNLIIDGNILIQNYGSGGTFGLTLSANPIADPVPANTIVGDLAPIDQDLATTGVQTKTDSLGNVITAPNVPELGRADTLYGGAGNDIIEGRGGSDILVGNAGDDRLYADSQISAAAAIVNGNIINSGSGTAGDWLNGGEGNDILVGGNANDLLAGGSGNDLLIGGAGDDVLLGDNDTQPANFPAQTWHYDPASNGIILENVLTNLPPDPATSGNDVIYAGEGNDIAFGGYGNDVIFGEGGNDILQGNSGNDILLGGSGNDDLYGDVLENNTVAAVPGDDYLAGGIGDDNLHGGAGNDLYVYNLGDGNDRIYDQIAAGETNTLRFGAGITLNSLKLSTGDNGYEITLGDGSTIQLMSGASGIINAQGNRTFDAQHTDLQQLQFADGSSIGWADFLKRGLDQRATVAGEAVLGSNYGDRLSGANATLNGGAGSDTYSYKAGDGVVHIQDVINGGDTNTLRFDSGISASQIKLRKGSLLLDMGNGDEIHLDNFNPDDALNSTTIQRFEFADGTVLNVADLLACGFDLDGTAGNDTLTGTNTTDRINGYAGDDTLIGGAGDDAINGGAGNDMLQGGAGNDTYLANLGDGQDELLDYNGTNNIVFGEGIGLADLTLSATIGSDGKTALLIQMGSNDSLTIDGGLKDGSTSQFVFADGSKLSMDQLFAQARWGTPSDIAKLESQYIAKQQADTVKWWGADQQADGSWYWPPQLSGGMLLYDSQVSQTFAYGAKSNTVQGESWQFYGNSIQDVVLNFQQTIITANDTVINAASFYSSSESYSQAGLRVAWTGSATPAYSEYLQNYRTGYLYQDGSVGLSYQPGATPVYGVLAESRATYVSQVVPFYSDVVSSLTPYTNDLSLSGQGGAISQVIPVTFQHLQLSTNYQTINVGPGNHAVYGGDVVNSGSGDNYIVDAKFVYSGTGNNTLYADSIVYAGSGNNTIERCGTVYAGSGNNTILDSTLVYGGTGSNRIDWADTVYYGSGNDVVTNSWMVYDGAGDDLYVGNDNVVTGSGNDTILSSISPNSGYWGTDTTINADMTGNVLVGGIAKIGGEIALNTFYQAQGITDWGLRYTSPNTYQMLFYNNLDPATAASAAESWYGLTLQQAIDQGIATYNAPLPVLAVVKGSEFQPSAYYAAAGVPVTQLPQIAANDYVSLAPLYAQMLAAPYPNNSLNNVAFGQGIAPADLQFSWGQVDIAISGSPTDPKSKYTTLNITWGAGSQSVQVIMPHFDEPVGSGVSMFSFADGTKLSMAGMIAMAPPAPSFDPQLFQYQLGMGSVAVGAGYEGIQFGPGITSSMITLGVGSLMLRVGDTGDVIHITSFDPANALAVNDIKAFKFADGTLLNYDQMLSRGFDLYGTSGDDTLTGTNLDNRIYGGGGNDTLIGSGAHDTLDGGAGNDTLVAGSGMETFVLNQGEGQDTIVYTQKSFSDTIRFGDGITVGSVFLSQQGSDLLVKYGTQGDSALITGFSLNGSAGNYQAIANVEFADGSVGSYRVDGQGNAYLNTYNNGQRVGAAYRNADGSYNSSTINADGSSSGVSYSVDGSYYTSASDGLGNSTTQYFDVNGIILNFNMFNSSPGGGWISTNYDAIGNKLDDTWVKNNSGIWTTGDDTFNADGSSSGNSRNSDGSYSSYANDGRGNVTTINFDASGRKLSDSWVKADGTYGNDIFNADGSSSGTGYDASGNKLSESWTRFDGTSGIGIFNADGTISGTSRNPDGSYATYTRDTLGKVTTTNFSADGTELGYGIATTDGSGVVTTVSYSPGGIESGHRVTVTGSDGIVTTTNYDVSGAMLGYKTVNPNWFGYVWTNSYDADGNKLSATWWHASDGYYRADIYNADGSGSASWRCANGAYGSDVWSADWSGSGEWHNADGSYGGYTQDAQGNYKEVNYAADGKMTGDSWWYADGSSAYDTFNADGSSSGGNYNADGSYSEYVNNGLGEITTNYFDVSGNLLNYSVVLDDGQGNVHTSNYAAAGTLLVDSWIHANSAPLAGIVADQTIAQDAAFSFRIPAGSFSDPNVNDMLTYSATLSDGGALPGWLTFDAHTQTFSGTPGNADVGKLNLVVTAIDTGGLSVTSAFNLSVANVNDAPVITAQIADRMVAQGTALGLAIPAGMFADQDIIHGDSLTYSASLADGTALPAWLTFDAATQTFSGTAGMGDLGVLPVKIVATDTGGLSATTQFNMTVANMITGTIYNDTLNGTAGLDYLQGMDGNDVINAGDGNDIIIGGAGSDILSGGAGDDTFLISETDTGYDRFQGDAGYDVIQGSAGDDTIRVNYFAGASTVEKIDGGLGVNVIAGTQYNDTIDLSGTSLVNIANINGGDGNDVITGSAGNDVITGGAGSDVLAGGAGNDTFLISGTDTGYDRFQGDAGYDVILGGAGDDTIRVNYFSGASTVEKIDGGAGVNTFAGTQYNDTIDLSGTSLVNIANIDGGVGNDVITGSAGNDIIVGGTGSDVLAGGTGDDTFLIAGSDAAYDRFQGDAGYDVIQGGAGDDTIRMNYFTGVSTVEKIDGGLGVNVVAGTQYNDTIDLSGTELINIANIDGGIGNDVITGSAGNDIIIGGSGSDVLAGGTGDDTFLISGVDTAYDRFQGDTGFDVIQGGAGDDAIRVNYFSGVSTVEKIDGGLGVNVIAGTQYNDTIDLSATELVNIANIDGGVGNDVITGSAGNDILFGGDGNDVLRDNSGNNLLDGGSGTDTLTGNAGNELFLGGIGNDTIAAGKGADIIVFNRGDGQDILNGGVGTDNTLSLGGGIQYSDLALSKSGNDLILEVGNGDQINLKNWYATTDNYKSVLNLQVVADAVAGFDRASADPLLNKSIQDFDFTTIVNAFDQARGSNTTFQHWSATSNLLAAHLSASDSVALGGDLAYQYGKNCSLAGASQTVAQEVINAAQFGSQAQVLKQFAGL